jgi:hypothetical protein
LSRSVLQMVLDSVAFLTLIPERFRVH